MENILCKSKNFDGIITTEKDWMRLREKKYELINSTEIIRLQIGVQFLDLEQKKIHYENKKSFIKKMKKLFSLSILILLITPLTMAQNGNPKLLYNWSDSTIVGSAAYNNVYNEIWGFTINNREFAVIGSTSSFIFLMLQIK